MSGPHIVSWLSVLAAAVGLGSTMTRLLVLLVGLRWALSDVAQADRLKIFREFARAASGRPSRACRLIHSARHYDSVCVRWSPAVPMSSAGIPEPLAGASKARLDPAVQEYGVR